MKERYIALMEKALSAYSDEHIVDYFERVKTEGLSEHGFPRLTVDIGILIAHGYRRDLLPLFLEMMDFCCHQIPRVLAANDFSIREVVCCIWEVEKAGLVDAARIGKWKADLATCDPYKCYNKIAKSLTDPVRNWALFSGVSEFYRQAMGLCESPEFIELQFGQQLQFFDENGMYCDNPKAEPYQPIMYDLTPRILYSLAIHRGYRGRYYDQIDAYLRKAGLLTLKMQSVTGEMAFGGRSNQFYHNEGTLCGVLEFEASRYAREGNMELAGRFKAAIARAVEFSEQALSQKPIYHIKNRFPTETKYGCERYAYFDKYMITAASNYYCAYLMCDDSIPTGEFDDSPVAWQTSERFHKVFLRAGRYTAELDTNGDPQFDATGLGRVHKAGAPSTICLSTPCPCAPHYAVDTEELFSFAMCPGVLKGGTRHYAFDPDATSEITNLAQGDSSATATMTTTFPEGDSVEATYVVDESGVSVSVNGKGTLSFGLPAFSFDGEERPEIKADEHELTVTYHGYVCRYTTSGKIEDSLKVARNRNGHYRVFYATANDTLSVHIEILKA